MISRMNFFPIDQSVMKTKTRLRCGELAYEIKRLREIVFRVLSPPRFA